MNRELALDNRDIIVSRLEYVNLVKTHLEANNDSQLSINYFKSQ